VLDDIAEPIEVGGPHGAQEGLERTEGGVVGLIQAEVAGLALAKC